MLLGQLGIKAAEALLGIFGGEIVKWGFWFKLPLSPLLWHANTVDEN